MFNQNSEKEDRGTVNTKQAEKNKGKGYFSKRVISQLHNFIYDIFITSYNMLIICL